MLTDLFREPMLMLNETTGYGDAAPVIEASHVPVSPPQRILEMSSHLRRSEFQKDQKRRPRGYEYEHEHEHEKRRGEGEGTVKVRRAFSPFSPAGEKGRG